VKTLCGARSIVVYVNCLASSVVEHPPLFTGSLESSRQGRRGVAIGAIPMRGDLAFDCRTATSCWESSASLLTPTNKGPGELRNGAFATRKTVMAKNKKECPHRCGAVEPSAALNAVCPYYTMFPLEFPLWVLGKTSALGKNDPFVLSKSDPH